MNILKGAWTLLAEKGKIATLIGMAMSFPVNGKFMIDFFLGAPWGHELLTALAVINGVAMIWFILPSRLKITGPKISIEVED